MESPRRVAQEPREEEAYGIGTHYWTLERIGEGTYGTVYKAVRLQDDEIVAIKRIHIALEDEGVPSTALREITLLKEVDSHPNVVKLHDVFSHRTNLFLVFDYLDMDLRQFLRMRDTRMDGALVRSCSLQLVCALEYCHNKRILHRDLKPQNVLVDVATTRLVVADFGLAKAFSVPLRVLTHEVVTLWFRAPEILLGQARYGPGIDIWSLGCIVAELATRQALFPGDSEIDTIFKICRCLGTPNEQAWPGVTTLKDFSPNLPQWPNSDFADVRAQACPTFGEAGVDFLRNCLKYDSVARQPAKVLKTHTFFDGMDAAGIAA